MKPSLLTRPSPSCTIWLSTGALFAQSPAALADRAFAAERRDPLSGRARAALKSDEFWPAMHAAEALTLAGKTDEVRAALAAPVA